MPSLKKAITLQPSITTVMPQVSNYFLINLEIEPHEAIYSNRAASFIAMKDYKRALEDC